ncbi:MAG: PAQR family membrane homeostasis protein TrhA [Egibacteraceae bacterium]
MATVVALRRDGKPLLRGWFHALAVPLAIVGTLVLWQAVEAPTARASLGVFGLSLIGLYSISAAYHLGRWSERNRRLLARADAAMIQLFIAGTFTPVAFFALDGNWRRWSLVLAWGIGLTGALIAGSPLRAPRWLSSLAYVAVGWLTVVPFTRMMAALPWQGIGLIILGGLLYTAGAVVYARRCPDPFPAWFGFHEVFHLLVIAASCAHYLAIWRYVLPAG